jgi:hypothetical protein
MRLMRPSGPDLQPSLPATLWSGGLRPSCLAAARCAAKSAAVSGRVGRNAAGPSGPAGSSRKTPSVTTACRWAWRLSPEPKRWRKETAPSRGRGPAAWPAHRGGAAQGSEGAQNRAASRSHPAQSSSPPRRLWGDRRALPAAAWALKSTTAARAPAGWHGRRGAPQSAPCACRCRRRGATR